MQPTRNLYETDVQRVMAAARVTTTERERTTNLPDADVRKSSPYTHCVTGACGGRVPSTPPGSCSESPGVHAEERFGSSRAQVRVP
jgi:hypothetical protein